MYHVRWIEETRKERKEGLFYLGDKPEEWKSLILALLFADEEQKIHKDRWRDRTMSYQVVDADSGEVLYDTVKNSGK